MKILIEGKRGEGKTTIASLLCTSLRAAGYTVYEKTQGVKSLKSVDLKAGDILIEEVFNLK